ncbi:MAG: hypothetical protein R2860_13345 [Desulfobacterales bacterium]
MIIDMHYHLDERMETMDHLLAQMAQFQIYRTTALIAPMVDPFHGRVADRLARFVRNLLTGFWQPLGKVAYETTVTKSGQFSFSAKHTILIVCRITRWWPMPWPPTRINSTAGFSLIRRTRMPNPSLKNTRTGRAGSGVKCHPFWHQYPVSILDDVAALCRAKELPLLIHLGGKKKTVIYLSSGPPPGA